MKLEDIRKEATQCEFDDLESLALKIVELRSKGVPFTGCVAFVQFNKNLSSIKEARDLLMQTDAFSADEKKKLDYWQAVMNAEYEEE